MNPEDKLNIGTIVVTTTEIPGVEYQGSRYGYVAKDMTGIVVGFTADDRRAMVAFDRIIHTNVDGYIKIAEDNGLLYSELMDLSEKIYKSHDLPF